MLSYSCGRLSNRFLLISMYVYIFHFTYTKTLRVRSLCNNFTCSNEIVLLLLFLFSRYIMFIYRLGSGGLALIMNNAYYCSMLKNCFVNIFFDWKTGCALHQNVDVSQFAHRINYFKSPSNILLFLFNIPNRSFSSFVHIYFFLHLFTFPMKKKNRRKSFKCSNWQRI